MSDRKKQAQLLNNRVSESTAQSMSNNGRSSPSSLNTTSDNKFLSNNNDNGREAQSANRASSSKSSKTRKRVHTDATGKLISNPSSSQLASTIKEVHAHPEVPVNIEPTTGKNAESAASICAGRITMLQKMVGEAQSAYDVFKAAVNKQLQELSGLTGVVDHFAPKANQFLIKRIQNADKTALRMLSECKKVCDPKQIYYRRMIYTTLFALDFAILFKAFGVYEQKLKDIEAIAASIKKENEAELKEILVPTSANKIERKHSVPIDKVYKKIVYGMKLYVVFPDTTQHYLHPYVTDFLYTKDFDGAAAPIYSMIFQLPPATLEAIKKHFTNLKWFLTITSKKAEAENTSNVFAIDNVIVDNIELLGIDPMFGNTNNTKGDPMHDQPVTGFKCDFIMKREIQANAEPTARVLKDARMIDALAFLCSKMMETSKKLELDSKRAIKFAITPPDNNRVYSEVVIKPGSFTDAVNYLQRAYGIYQAGVRVSFDTTHQVKGSTKKQVTETINVVTITEKGTPVPLPDGQENTIIEVIDMRNTTLPMHDNGSYIDHETKTTSIRTTEPYKLIMANSPTLVKGESVRVMNTSKSDHIVSICDNNYSDIGAQRIVWSKFSNPYNITQYEDNAREKTLGVQVEVRDVDVLSLNDNMLYTIKFYSPDDEIASGVYRLTKVEAIFKHKRTTSKDYIIPSAILTFTDRRELRAAGSNIPRLSYGEKLAVAAEEAGQGSGSSSTGAPSSIASKTSTGSSKALSETRRHSGFSLARPPKVKDIKPSKGGGNSRGAKYRCRFGGRKDIYGQTIPDIMPDTYKMSETTILADVFNTTTGVYATEPVSLMSNYEYFIATQTFAKECVDKINNAYGKFKGSNGKAIDWFKVKGDTSSLHLTGEAIDLKLKPGGDKVLIDSFIELINKPELGWTHLSIEGNGKAWSHIHFERSPSDANAGRKKISVSPRGVGAYELLPQDYEDAKALKLLKQNLEFGKAKLRFNA